MKKPNTAGTPTTTTKKSPTWSITEYGCVVAHYGKRRMACIFLETFYLPSEDTASTISHLLGTCKEEGMDIKLTFSRLVAVVKKHFPLGTVAKMHMFEQYV